METKELMQMLRAPFNDDELEKKVQSTNQNKTQGMVAFYVSARAIQNRLDEVFGFDGWKTSYKEVNGGYICSLSVKVNGEWITKEDGAPATQYESIKGGISNAFKRVASSGFGIGRYLYDSIAEWHPIKQQGKGYVFTNPENIKLKLKKKNTSVVTQPIESKEEKKDEVQSDKILVLDRKNKAMMIGTEKAQEIINRYSKFKGGEFKIKAIMNFYNIESMAYLRNRDLEELEKYGYDLEKIAKARKIA